MQSGCIIILARSFSTKPACLEKNLSANFYLIFWPRAEKRPCSGFFIWFSVCSKFAPTACSILIFLCELGNLMRWDIRAISLAHDWLRVHHISLTCMCPSTLYGAGAELRICDDSTSIFCWNVLPIWAYCLVFRTPDKLRVWYAIPLVYGKPSAAPKGRKLILGTYGLICVIFLCDSLSTEALHSCSGTVAKCLKMEL